MSYVQLSGACPDIAPILPSQAGREASRIIEKAPGGWSTGMMDGKPIATGRAEQDHPLVEEARLARIQAEEAILRIQHRIERLVSLCEAVNQPRSNDDGQEPRV